MNYANLLPWYVADPQPSLYTDGVPLFVDFETTNHDKGSALNAHNRIVLACWQEGWDGTLRLKRGSEYEQDELLAAISRADFIVAHNAKFELQWLARCGLDLHNVVVYDTMVAEYVIGGNRWMLHQLGLDTTLARHGLPGKESVVGKMIKAGICPSEIPEEWLHQYARQDVRMLPELMYSQLEQMKGTKLLPIVYNRCLLTPALADMETVGMRLDVNLVRKRYEDTKAEYDELTRQMNELTGGLNMKSRPTLAKYLYETLDFPELVVRKGRDWLPKRTGGGARCTDGDTLLALKATTPEQREFKDLYMRLNDCGQLLSKYLTKFNDCATEAGGLLYANFNQTNTQTHRLSSTGREYAAQFQNFPRAFKPLFEALDDGHLVGEVDGAQLEFRVAAHLGRCVAALEDIEDDVDVHTYTASVLTEAGQRTDRQGAKEHTFKPLYGGQSGTDAEKAYYKAFREKYPGIATTQQGWIAKVLEHKYLETEWGMRYYWPDTTMDRSGYVRNSTSICNYPVQAFATAEIIPAAIVLMWHVVHRLGVGIKLMNTVHDSIIADLAPDTVDTFHAVSKWALIDGVYDFIEKLYGIRLVCRLGCGIKIADHWGATKDETKYEADASLYKEAA